MSTTFYNIFSITISYGKNFGVSIYTGKPNEFQKATLASQNLGAFNLKYEMKRTYQFSKRLRALLKFWRILKQMYMERTECVPKGDFGPAEAVGRSQTRPVESLGTHSVHLHTLYLNISTKIFISFKLHLLNLFNNIWCFLVYIIV